MSDASKPYLDWLDNNASPPALLSTAGWTRAASILIDRLRAARNAVVSGDPLLAAEEYADTDCKLSSLVAWVEHSGPRTPRIRLDSMAAEVLRLQRRREQVARTAGKGRGLGILDGLLRRRRHPLPPAQRTMVEDIRDSWRESRKPIQTQNGIRTERALARHFKRQETYQDECVAKGVPLTRAQAQQLPPIFRMQARLAARQRGWKRGWFVTADSDLGREALGHLDDRDLRESLWRQRQAIKENSVSVSEVLRLRHEEAKRNGHEHYASYQVLSRAVGQVRSVSAILNNFLESSRSSSDRLERRLVLAAQEYGIDEIQPWDRLWLIERLRSVKPTGRVVLQLQPGQTTLPDLALEDGDRIHIPPQATTIGVFGSVFNGGSYLYSDGREVQDYMRLAGGPTRGADASSAFVIRANGSVVSGRQRGGWFGGGELSGVAALPGDTIFVPEEIDKTTFVQSAKDWTQIIYQLGIGLAGVATVIK